MSERRLTNKIKIAVAAVVAVLAIIVILQNTQDVETRLLFFPVSMPLALLLLVTLLLGVVLGLMTAVRIRRKPNT
jgi:uncharacterized integral membrane protein